MISIWQPLLGHFNCSAFYSRWVKKGHWAFFKTSLCVFLDVSVLCNVLEGCYIIRCCDLFPFRNWRRGLGWTDESWSPSSSPFWWPWSSTCTSLSMRSCPIIDASCKTLSKSPPSGESSSPDRFILRSPQPYAHHQHPQSSADVGTTRLFHLFSKTSF